MASNSAATASESGVDLQRTESAWHHAPAHLAMWSLLNIVFPFEKPSPEFSPILQIFEVWKGRDEESEEDQVRLVLTDGRNLQRALLTHEARNIIFEHINPGSVVQLTKYTLHPTVNDWEKKRLIKIIDMEIIANGLPLAESPRYFNIGDDEMQYWREENWGESRWDDPDPWEVDESDPYIIGVAARAA